MSEWEVDADVCVIGGVNSGKHGQMGGGTDG